MGNVYSTPPIPDELMEEYLQLTFLTYNEILRIYQRMSSLYSGKIGKDINYRFRWDDVLTVFPELKVNPFEDRLCAVFSSKNDFRLSFEDVLDMCSVLSPNCSPECKAKWALKLFDFNDTNAIEKEDISEIIDRLTNGCPMKDKFSPVLTNPQGSLNKKATLQPSTPKLISKEQKEAIANIILEEIDLDHTGAIVTMEFVHAVSKIPDFCESFTLKL